MMPREAAMFSTRPSAPDPAEFLLLSLWDHFYVTQYLVLSLQLPFRFTPTLGQDVNLG